MAQASLPVGKYEFNDGTSWFSLASENWVLNTINKIAPCNVATTANLNATYSNGTSGVGATLTNAGSFAALAIDGLNLAVGNRVLVKDQTTQTQNGIYTVTNSGSGAVAWVLTRATDFDSIAQMVRGQTIEIHSGTANGVTIFMLTSNVTVVGSANITFNEITTSGISNALGTANQIVVSIDTAGVATFSLATNPTIPGTGYVVIPTGTTAQRPSTPTAGMLRLNTSLTT